MKQAGFSVIEVMMTIVIVSVGIMGLAGLQAQMIVAEMESFDRAQAVTYLDDMASRINASRRPIEEYIIATTATPALPVPATAIDPNSYIIAVNAPAGAGTLDDDTPCGITAAPADQICQWANLLRGTTERLSAGSEQTTSINLQMRGCIELLSTTPVQYRISVTWRGRSRGFTPAALTCASAVYGAGTSGLRRIVSTNVILPNLSGS
jgi:type IV pilus assembly protein PilV